MKDRFRFLYIKAAVAIAAVVQLACTGPLSADLPGNAGDRAFDKKVASLDLEDRSYEFTYKTSGTSIGFKVASPGKRNSGMWVPECSATNLEAEVVSYRLSRVLGVSENFNPASYYELGPGAISRFKSMMRSEKNKWRRENTGKVRSRISSNSQTLFGIYKFRHKRSSQDISRLASGNRLKTSHPLARFIRGDGPMPGTKRIGVPGVRAEASGAPSPTESEAVLASQLSTMFVIDMLTGQWDRFSGGNIEAYAHKDGRLQLISRDNGGASLSWNTSAWYNRYASWVTRFDRQLVERLVALDQFLSGKEGKFENFTSVDQFRKEAGFLSDRSFGKFRGKLSSFCGTHVPKCEKRYGNGAYFP